MRIHPIDRRVKEIWKHFPLRLPGRGRSACHNRPSLLVQSMEGGFVTQNCSACGKQQSLSEREFRELDLWIACPECKRRMEPTLLAKNYGYGCTSCDIGIELAALLPRWEEL